MIRAHLPLFLTFAWILLPLTAWLQCPDQVTHTSGTQLIGCTSVTVTPSQFYAEEFTSYCSASTQPYHVGFEANTGLCGDGFYTFDFNPPVNGVSLNLSAISNDGGNHEMIVLYVNGAHYAVPALTTTNGCEPLALLTPEGNISGNIPGMGCNDLTINGPISQITVKDSVWEGQPAGTVFSLFICPADNTGFNIDLGNDTILCDGDTLLLDPQIANAFLTWQDGANTSFFEVTTSDTYSVNASLNGCTASDTIIVTYLLCEPPPVIPSFVLEMPNVFTPDGNGLNDLFAALQSTGISDASLTIVNRWGNTLFSGELSAGWNGKSEGKTCNEGVYFYRVDYRIPDGTRQTAQGFVELVR